MSPGVAPAIAAPSKSESSQLWRRFLRIVAFAVVAFLLLLVALIINNNFAFRSPSRAEFVAELDHAIETSTQWMSDHPEIMGSPTLMFIIGDMAKLSPDPRMRNMASTYLNSHYVRRKESPISWYYARMVDGTTEVPTLTILDMGGVIWQDRIDAFGVFPRKVELPERERAELLSPYSYTWGARLHQLIALDIYRRFNGPSP